MKQRLVLSMILMFLFFLSGCNRPSLQNNTIKSHHESSLIYQRTGEKLIRSVTMYEQFELIGRFAALWVNNVELAQKKLNSDSISFYVLSLNQVHFNEPSSEWQIALKINDTIFQPTMVKRVALPLEYRLFFGVYFSQYKIVYLITFKAVDENNVSLIQPNTSMKLEISFEDRQGHMVWNFNDRALLMPHFESYYRKGN